MSASGIPMKMHKVGVQVLLYPDGRYSVAKAGPTNTGWAGAILQHGAVIHNIVADLPLPAEKPVYWATTEFDR
jgi:hypothetical protein